MPLSRNKDTNFIRPLIPCSSAEVWSAVRRIAEGVVATEPLLNGYLTASILAHGDLGSVLACKIAERLGKRQEQSDLITRIAREAFTSAPQLVDAAALDLCCIRERDPATNGLLSPLLHYKGYIALQAYRLSHWLWKTDRRDLALWLQSECSSSLQVSIHPSARIGSSVLLDHATGIVIGPSVYIGDGTSVLQHVTISPDDADRSAPTIGRGVLLSTGATVLGGITVGEFAKIGAGAVVLSDVPARCTAIGAPARLVNCSERNQAQED
jgi:serine O-acetyltransferase